MGLIEITILERKFSWDFDWIAFFGITWSFYIQVEKSFFKPRDWNFGWEPCNTTMDKTMQYWFGPFKASFSRYLVEANSAN